MARPTASPTNPHVPFILSEIVRDSGKCPYLLLHNSTAAQPESLQITQPLSKQLLHYCHTTLPLPPFSCPLLSSSLNEVPHPGPFSPHQKPQHLLHCLPDHVDSTTLPLVLGGSSRHRVLLSVGGTGIPSCQLLCKPRGNRKREMSAPSPSCTEFLPQIPHLLLCWCLSSSVFMDSGEQV